ncbi:MAG: FAD-dependent monooxygenase [Colwellia sp.]|nr:FAD-dependent monooxygenase [Colwellia sp.]
MNISILGGGIGGLSTAIALKQAGFDVEVYERHSQPIEIGAGIVCWPNASFVLAQLGLLDKVAELAGPVIAMNRFCSSGESLGSLNIDELNRLMKYPSYSILRKDLMKILTQRSVELNINIHYQHTVRSLFNNSGSVYVQFSCGKVIEADIIISADGRRLYVTENNSPIYQGSVNWIGVFETDTALFTELSVADYWGVGERFGIVPVSKTKAYWAGGVTAEHTGEIKPERYKSELSALFSHWSGLIEQVINETPLSRIHQVYVHDHDPIDCWHKDNVLLLGDAAHAPLPTSGQGACQALEDAWHMTQCLTDNSNDIEKAFRQFTSLRIAKTSGITLGGRHLAAAIFNNDSSFCKQRNLASKSTNYNEVVAGMAKGWSNGLPIGV